MMLLDRLMSMQDLKIQTKIRDAEKEIDRIERMVTIAIFVTVLIAIATYSAIL
jgi:hypothetical protein